LWGKGFVESEGLRSGTASEMSNPDKTPWFGNPDKVWCWMDVPTSTTVTDNWTLLVLDTGFKILTFGEKFAAGASVHVLRPDNTEVQSWEASEWELEGEGELVVGAFLRMAGGQ
jgi:hypothetical protein